jgi:hypothetical protein
MRHHALAVAIALTYGVPVRASEPDARALFEKGVGAMVQGHYPEACSLIAEANRREPQRPGVIFTLAECTRHLGVGERTAAVSYYEQFAGLYAAMSADEKKQQAPRMATAERELTELKTQLASLVIVLDGTAHTRRITCDGVSIALGQPAWVERGDHTVHLTFDDAAPYDSRVTLSAGEMRKLVVKPTPGSSEESKERTPSTMLVGALVSGGIGVVGIIAGTIEGVVALDQKSVIVAHCANTVCDTAGDASTANAAKVNGWISTIGFAVGAVGLGLGGVLLYFDIKSHRRQVALRARGLGLAIEGTW